MGELPDYKDRFAEAMRLAGLDEHAIAKGLDVSYQAIKKVLLGTTKMLRADNNVFAARLMSVDPDWLATGSGSARGPKVWPFSPELLAAASAADPQQRRQAENAARSCLDLDALPRIGKSPAEIAGDPPKPAPMTSVKPRKPLGQRAA